jgi:hypothetical protein
MVAIAVIPSWYIYRTLEEKRVRKLEWSEVFMTEPERQKKWAEDKQRKKEEAEAAKVKAATELAQSITAKKNAEAEAAKAEAELLEKRNQEAAETARRRDDDARRQIEVSRQAAAAETARVRAEGERAARQQSVAARLAMCGTAAAAAEARLQDLIAEQKSYKAFIAESAAVPISLASWDAEKFSVTFRRFERTSFLTSESEMREIRKQKDACSAVAIDDSKNDNLQLQWAFRDIDNIETQYRSAIGSLRASRSDIQDLVDFATGKLPKTVGGEVKRERIKRALDEYYKYR